MLPQTTHRLLVALVPFALAALGAVVVGQVSIEPPPAPLPSSLASPVPPATQRASTLPSAESVLQGIMRDKPVETSLPASKGTTGSTAQPVLEGAAPNQPRTVLTCEGDYIWNRTGRLVRDEKTGAMAFVFDTDGKQMSDPPMGLIPCRYLAQMEDASDHGAKATKFRISGEITEYRGKNYIYLKVLQVVQDLNQGIGTGRQGG